MNFTSGISRLAASSVLDPLCCTNAWALSVPEILKDVAVNGITKPLPLGKRRGKQAFMSLSNAPVDPMSLSSDYTSNANKFFSNRNSILQ